MSSLNEFEETEMIHQSWDRCRQLGLKPTDAVHDQMITEKQLQEIMKENEGLIQHTTSIFEKLFPFMKHTEHVAVLVDQNGIIIHTAGDQFFEEQARKIQLQVGTSWQEQYKGTNAMGVALIEGKPIRIHGKQHFYITNHFLTCAASPIYNSTGELIGAINISGRKEQFNPYTLSLACMIADSLQNRLLFEQAKREHFLTLKELEHTVNYHPLPLLSLDKDHRIIRANQAAHRILGMDCIGKEFKGKKGFIVETISDNTRKIWCSVAIYKNEEKKENRLYNFDDIAGSCPSILRVKELAQKASCTDFPILLYGESGTGKELLAQSIHSASLRTEYPFIAVNCSAIPESLVESELFGYERGAFTGANREGGQGKFEAAHLGTIFLDEISDMSLRAQAALLRVLQEKRITRVGGVKSESVDIRIIAATNKDLSEEVKAGRFRADLYYRLKGIQITLPPLRERSDIIPLAEYLLDKMNYPTRVLSKETEKKLLTHNWPGNVRELNSVLIQASFLAEGGEISPEHIQLENISVRPEDDNAESIPSLIEAEINAIKKSLQVTGWNISKAAKLLQIGRNTLYNKIKEYNISQL
ncbi:sigma-54-dependent Fis family transcriptional regulator [Effusibacillus dendaii]|uniref:Acetoin dehydrogenase operon transcriptional activator AcoR n=1 Tax=Effusibacillus dendaii TaxID=2743772 RepID=A0A7I8D7G1_9BACL|nr:sigma-54-dependent Fis family transcriptional regulator [Effusibacillus dendaii]BCJ86034.1 acetoin dehydrogenase operon transcriptional activator AcoR [Effusibacillus dendaii]